MNKLNNFIDKFLQVFSKSIYGIILIIAIYLLNISIYFFTNKFIIVKILAIIISLILIFFIQNFLNKNVKFTKSDFLNFKKYKNKKLFFIKWIVILICTLFFSILFVLLFYKNDYINAPININKINILYFIQPILLAPIIEEFLYRQVLYNYFRISFNNKNLSICISSIVFGLMHILPLILVSNNIYFLIIYCLQKIIVGFVFTIVYSKTQNIYYSIAFHMLYNLIVILI